jgi:hypothetical protein
MPRGTRVLSSVLVAIAVTTTTLSVARADVSAPTPAGYHVEARIRERMVLAGALFFGIPYTLSCVAGVVDTDARALIVPVAGPILQLSRRPQTTGDAISDAGNRLGTSVLLVADAFAQTSGAIALIVGLAWQKEVLVPDGGVSVRATPMRVGESANGFGLVGSF